MKHKKWILAAIAVVSLLGATLVWGTASGYFVDEIADRVEDELGLPIDFESLEIAENQVTFREVSASLPSGAAAFDAETLVVDGDLVALARRTPGSLHAVSMAGVDAHVDLDDPEARDLADRLRSLAGSSDDTDDDEASETDESEDAAASLLAYTDLLRDGGTLRVEQMRLVTTLEGVTEPVLEGTDLELVKASHEVFATQGSGRSTNGGDFRWDIDADLGETALSGQFGWTDLRLEPLMAFAPDLPIRDADTARSSGDLRFEHLGAGDLRLEGEFSTVGLTVDSPKLSSRPLENLRIGAAGSATWHHADRHLVIDEAKLRSRKAEAVFTGDVVWAEDHYSIDLDGTLPTTRCGEAMSAIPADLLGRYQGFALAGEIAGDLVLEVDSRDLDATTLEIEIDDDCRFREVPELADLDRFERPFQHTARGPDGPIHAFRTGPGTEAWTPIGQISPFLIQAVLAHEDAGFFRHDGFAVYAMEAALETNLEEGRYVRGASTISMQLAKNLFLSREKTLARKVREVLLTWWLESRLDKDEILELYLNVIEYGPEIYGVRDASTHYFGREPIDLTPAESVFLASILPSPVPSHRQYEKGALTASTRNDMSFLLRHMHRKGRLDAQALAFGRAELDDFRFHKGPQLKSPVERYMGEAGDLPFQVAESRFQTPHYRALAESTVADPSAAGAYASRRGLRTRTAGHVIYDTERGLRVRSQNPEERE